MAIKIQGGATTNLAEVDAAKNLKTNTFYAAPVVTHGTFAVTTTLAAAGGKINCTGYKYIKIFGNATMTANLKTVSLFFSESHTVGGNLYPGRFPSNADIIGVNTVDNDKLVDGLYLSANPSVILRSKLSGTDYVTRGSITMSTMGIAELQIYIYHNDTGNINTTIDYILFND